MPLVQIPAILHLVLALSERHLRFDASSADNIR